MKTKTDLKAGIAPGACHMKVNRFGKCKKILCPYPPFKFPCYRTDLIGPGPIYYGSETEEEPLAE
jgi:hypothetical protein